MPFTFAHPLYIVPVKYINPKYFSLAGLVLGSMSPDFEFFIVLEPYQTIGHTFKGLIMQAIPLSLLILMLLQFVMRPFALHLPSAFGLDMRLYSAIRYFEAKKFRNWAVFISSVVIGFYSHLLVDSFTHASGYFVQKLPALQSGFFGLPMYKVLQYSLSVVGVMVQACLIWMILMKKSPVARNFQVAKISPKRKTAYWMIVLLVTFGITGAKLLSATNSNLLGILIVSPISGCILGIVTASFIYRKI